MGTYRLVWMLIGSEIVSRNYAASGKGPLCSGASQFAAGYVADWLSIDKRMSCTISDDALSIFAWHTAPQPANTPAGCTKQTAQLSLGLLRLLCASGALWNKNQQRFTLTPDFTLSPIFETVVSCDKNKKNTAADVLRCFWWEQRESNPRPSACKADALNQLSYAPKQTCSWTRTWTWDPLINSQML